MLEPLIRKLLQQYWRLSRGLTLGVRGAVLDEQGRFLLLRHTYMPGWTFPGGGVEFGETLEAALIRELDEEVAVQPLGSLQLFGMYSNHVHFPGDHVGLYVIRSWRHIRPPAPNREIAEFGFFAPDALPSGTTRGAQRRIEEILEKRERIGTW